MSDDLVNRLREEDFLSDWRISDYQQQKRMELERAEAADRIEAQSAAIDAALAELNASLFTNAEHQRAKDILRAAREDTK